jgi:hypothetical protein
LVRPTGFEPVACGFGGIGMQVLSVYRNGNYGGMNTVLHQMLHRRTGSLGAYLQVVSHGLRGIRPSVSGAAIAL